jgi:hypothetical protein
MMVVLKLKSFFSFHLQRKDPPGLGLVKSFSSGLCICGNNGERLGLGDSVCGAFASYGIMYYGEFWNFAFRYMHKITNNCSGSGGNDDVFM